MGFDLFNPKTQPLIGVDVSSSSIKMVELSQTKSGIRLDRYAITTLGDDVISEGTVSNSEGLTNGLQNCYKKLGSKIKNVASALPGSFIVSKTANFRADLSEKELEDQVMAELANSLSFDINEAGVDFYIVPETLNTELNEVAVMMFAALRMRIDDRAGAFESAGLKPLVMDSDSLAMVDCIEQFLQRTNTNTSDKIILAMDIGSTATHFTFLRNGETVYMRDHAFGGSQLTRDMHEQFGVSVAEAEKFKVGGVPEDKEQLFLDLSKNFAEAVANEARRAVQLFTTSTNFTHVDLILLYGGGAVSQGLVEAIREVLPVDAQLMSPFDGMQIASSVDMSKLKKDAPALVIACGLAMRRFDK